MFFHKFKYSIYYGLIDSGTNRLLILSKGDPATLYYLKEMQLDSDVVKIVPNNYFQKKFLDSLITSVEKYNFIFNERKGFLEYSKYTLNDLKELYMLLTLKFVLIQSLLDYLKEIHLEGKKFPNMEYIYLAKKLEAKLLVSLDDNEVNPLDFPYIYYDAKEKNLNLLDTAKEILVRASLYDSKLAALEAKRGQLLKEIKEAKIKDELAKINLKLKELNSL